MTPVVAPWPSAAPPPDEGFLTRFLAELARRPVTLLATSLFTALALGLVIDGSAMASASGRPPPASPSAPPPAPAPGAPARLAPGDVHGWTAEARRAASTCPGLPHEVLVAIGQVETRLGRGVARSSAGALGPMQFLPTTWAAYGTDGNGDGVADIHNPLDALHGAARLLCANGGATPDRLRSALWNYNHSPDYVDRVVRVAGLPY